MQFGKSITVCGFVLLGASGAVAETVTESIVQQLSNQGYTQITISRTLLGRSRIVAIGQTRNREIVVNPRTGEILRDFRSAVSGAPTITSDDLNIDESQNEDTGDDDRDEDSDGDDGRDGDSDGDDGRDGDSDSDSDSDGGGDGDSDGDGGGDSDGGGDGDSDGGGDD